MILLVDSREQAPRMLLACLLLWLIGIGCQKTSPSLKGGGVEVLILREGLCREGVLWWSEQDQRLWVEMDGTGLIPCPTEELSTYR